MPQLAGAGEKEKPTECEKQTSGQTDMERTRARIFDETKGDQIRESMSDNILRPREFLRGLRGITRERGGRRERGLMVQGEMP